MLYQHHSNLIESFPDESIAINDKRREELLWINNRLGNEIVELRKVENELKKAEEKYRNIFDHAVEGIFQTTPEGYFVSANRALAHIFGYNSPEELINSINCIGSQIYVDPEYRATFTRILSENNTTQHFTTQCRRKDGAVIWVSISARAVRDLKNNILYFEGFLQDVTEQKRAEYALKESEERYRISIEHSNDGVSITKKNIHEYVNNKFMEMFGFNDSDEIIGKSLTKIIHPDDRERVMKYSDLRYRGGNAPARYEFRGIKKGRFFIVLLVYMFW